MSRAGNGSTLPDGVNVGIEVMIQFQEPEGGNESDASLRETLGEDTRKLGRGERPCRFRVKHL